MSDLRVCTVVQGKVNKQTPRVTQAGDGEKEESGSELQGEVELQKASQVPFWGTESSLGHEGRPAVRAVGTSGLFASEGGARCCLRGMLKWSHAASVCGD